MLAPKLVAKKPKLFPPNATLPPPRFSKIQDRGNSHQSWKFFEYWKELAGTISEPTEKADLVEVRFYMHWPVISLKLVEPNRTTTEFETMAGPMWFDDPEEYIEEVAKRLGSGGWHVVLNEANVHGQLCEAYFSAIDLDRYPVKIDLRTLVKTDPKNQDYVRWLGVNGIKTPWSDTPEEQEKEMANEVLGVVTEILRDSNKTSIESQKELSAVLIDQAKAEAERAREDADKKEKEMEQGRDKRANVDSAAISLMSDVTKDLVGMAREEKQRPDNTLEVLKAAVEIVRPVQLAADKSEAAMFITAMKDMQTQNLEFMRSVVGLKKTESGTWVMEQGQAKPAGFMEEITRFQQMADVMGWRRPGAEVAIRNEPQASGPPPKGFWDALAEHPAEFMGGLTMIFTLGANIVFNLMGGKGNATSPAEAVQKSQAPPPQQQPQQQQTQQHQFPAKDPRAWLTWANQILPAFKVHYWGENQGLGGISFAEFVLGNGTGGAEVPDGRKAYMMLKNTLTPAGFDQLVRMVPAWWAEVKDTQDQYKKFLAEFFGYDEFIQKQNEKASAA